LQYRIAKPANRLEGLLNMHIYRLLTIVLMIACTQAIGQISFWTNVGTPVVPEATDDRLSVTLGLKFYSDIAGSVTGVRFYKGRNNTGLHIGTLWSGTGVKLATVTFSGETASGWQQATFSSPVSIAANTPYVISYTAPNGGYAVDKPYSWSTLSSGSLHVSGSSPGVFTYGSNVFPKNSWYDSNYWVDVLFSPNRVDTSFWSNSATPVVPEATDDRLSVTLGLKFYSDIAGSVTGVRFYKGSNNSGLHMGTLWSGTGVKLATVTFSGETASGWQQATFSSPVSIAASTSYVISYTAPNGGYAVDKPYSWSTLSSGSLHVSGSSPGVFAYGSNIFPNSSWYSSNYWVDVVFSSSTGTNPSNPAPATYSISGTVSGSAATLTLSGAASGSTTTDSAGRYSFTGLANGTYVVAPTQTGSTITPVTALAVVNGVSITGLNFTATSTPAPISRSITLSWAGSSSGSIQGYNLYRAEVAGGAFTKLNASPIATTGFTDSNVASGRTYYYVATAVDTSNNESEYSNEATAPVPTP
jgi:hypothetical protein